MSLKVCNGAELQAAKRAAAERFLAIAEAIKTEAGVVHHRVIKGLHGCAFLKRGIIHAPEGRTRKQPYIIAHECGHVALNHDSAEPRHVEEHEAELWAHAALRRHGVPVPRKMTQRAKRYVAHKIQQAEHGANRIDAAAARFAKQSHANSRNARMNRPPSGQSQPPNARRTPMGERKDYAYGTSDYLKADELAGKSARVVISAVEDVEFDKGLKPVLSFEGKRKRLVVNATNFDILCACISNNTNDWVGHVIMLRGEKTSFRGKLVDSIRVSCVPKQQTKQQPAKEASPDYFEDEIPDFAT